MIDEQRLEQWAREELEYLTAPDIKGDPDSIASLQSVLALCETVRAMQAALDEATGACHEWAALHGAAVARAEQAERERDALMVQVDQWRRMADREVTACVEMRAERDAARAEAAQARAERDEARTALDGWVKWASTSRCIYCGQEFTHDPHDQEAADEPKKAHILVCESHPLRQAKAENATLRAELQAAQAEAAQLRGTVDALTNGELGRMPTQARLRQAHPTPAQEGQ